MATAPSHVNVSVGAFGSEGSSRVFTSHEETKVNNLLIAQIFVLNTVLTVKAPTGWHELGQVEVANEFVIAWFWKIADTNASVAYEFKWEKDSGACAGFIETIKGNSVLSPIADFKIESKEVENTEVIWGSVSPSMSNTLSCIMYGSAGGTIPPSEYTEQLDQTALYLATKVLLSSGPSGKQFGVTEAGVSKTINIAVAPLEESSGGKSTYFDIKEHGIQYRKF